MTHFFIDGQCTVVDYYLRQRRRYKFLPVFVCLSFLLARLLENAYMDLLEMLRVDRCRDMDELINI